MGRRRRVHFLGDDGPCRAGLDVAARTVLRLGVALLGFRISFASIADLGWGVVIFVMICVALTILSGIALAPLFGHRWRFGVLSYAPSPSHWDSACGRDDQRSRLTFTPL